jgi:hypothetical protein
MFVLRSTHQKLLSAEKAHHESLIAQMQEQIADLRRLVFVPTPTPAETHPIRLANAILDGVEVMPKVDPEQEAADLAEANRILSGQYDNQEEAW